LSCAVLAVVCVELFACSSAAGVGASAAAGGVESSGVFVSLFIHPLNTANVKRTSLLVLNGRP
jgi:hypothetical protein